MSAHAVSVVTMTESRLCLVGEACIQFFRYGNRVGSTYAILDTGIVARMPLHKIETATAEQLQEREHCHGIYPKESQRHSTRPAYLTWQGNGPRTPLAFS